MESFYDPTLGSRLDGANSLVINPSFSKWNSWLMHVGEEAVNGNGHKWSDPMYDGFQENTELLEEAKEHLERHNHTLDKPFIFTLVHPFFLHCSDMDLLRGPNMKKDAQVYLGLLLRVLMRRDLPKDKVGIAVLEDLHTYAAVTSLLLERGEIDRVILTGGHRGYLLDKNSVNPLKGKRLFVGGSYNGFCLSAALDELHAGVSLDNLQVIKDLTIERPQDGTTLRPKRIYYSEADNVLPKEKVISLETALHEISTSSLN